MEKKATRQAYGETLVELGEKNTRIVVLDADLSHSTMTHLFAKKFKDRFFNVGVAEQNLMNMAAGFSLAGLIPFASTFAIFATGRAWDQVRNTIAYSRLNVKIAASHAGITVGPDGATHQATEDVGLMRVIPDMAVVVPSDAVETEAVVRWAADYVGPVYIRLARAAVPVMHDRSCYHFDPGKGQILKDGDDVTIMNCGILLQQCFDACKMLEKEGIRARLVNMPSIKPIDVGLIIRCATQTAGIVTVEEHQTHCGFGSAVAEVVVENSPAPMAMVGLRNVFGESGEPQELLEHFGLTAKVIFEKAMELCRKERK